MQSFDVAVGLRTAGADLGVRGAGRESRVELAATELVAVVGEDALELPAGGLEFGGDLRASAEVCSTVGPAGGQTTRSAQAKLE